MAESFAADPLPVADADSGRRGPMPIERSPAIAIAARQPAAARPILAPAPRPSPAIEIDDDWDAFEDPLPGEDDEGETLIGIKGRIEEKWFGPSRGYLAIRWSEFDESKGRTVKRSRHIKGSRIRGRGPKGTKGGRRKAAA